MIGEEVFIQYQNFLLWTCRIISVFQIQLFDAKDIHNEKIFRVRYEEQSELDKLRARLGFLMIFANLRWI